MSPFTKQPEPPDEFKDVLGRYSCVATDLGKPVAYGFPVIRHMSEARFNDLYKYGRPICISMGNWVLATDILTPQQAVELYGTVTAINLGPQGGWRSATYGTSTFQWKDMDPRGIIDNLPDPVREERAKPVKRPEIPTWRRPTW